MIGTASRLAMSALAFTATSDAMAAQAASQWSSRYGNLGAVAIAGCQRLRGAATLSAIDAELGRMEGSEFLLLRNAIEQARADSNLASFSATGFDNQRQRWIADRDRASRALADVRANGARGRDRDPAIALAAAGIVKREKERAEREDLLEALRAAITALNARNASDTDDLLSGTTVDQTKLEDNVADAQTALENHIASTGLESLSEFDPDIARRKAEHMALLRGYDGLRLREREAEIGQLNAQIADAETRIRTLRGEAEALRQAAWYAHWAEQDVRNCAVARGRELGAAGAPQRPGPVPLPPPQVTLPVPPSQVTPPVVPPVALPTRGPTPTAARIETYGAFAAPSDTSHWTRSQTMFLNLTYYEDGSVTGTVTGGYGATLGSLSGRWANGSARGRLSLSDEVLQTPGSGGSGRWELSFPAGGQGRPTGAWCIVSSGSDRRVGRQFGMLYSPGNSIVFQRSTSDPLCN